MSTEQEIKQQVMCMAVGEIEILLNIISDLGYVGYKISMCKIKGFSYMQCAQKFGIPKSTAQSYWEKCTQKAYDIALRKLFNIK